MKKVGVYFGTFAPLHTGHLHCIDMALKENDRVVVAVSGYKGDRGDCYGLPVDLRYRLVKDEIKGRGLTDKVEVKELIEDSIPKYPNGWEPWLTLLEEVTAIPKGTLVTYYTGEPEYKSMFNELRPNARVEVVDRRTIGVSATQIRKDPLSNRMKIAKSFIGEMDRINS